MKRFFQRLIGRIENAPLSLPLFTAAFFALIIARLSAENTLGLFAEHSLFFFFFEFTHTFLFFLCSFFLLLPVVRLAGAETLKKSANILLFGFLVILTPPVLDTLIIGRGKFWSFYEFDGLFGLLRRFFTLFGDTPDIGITYGVRIEVVIVTIALGLYAFLKGKPMIRVLSVALLAYTVLFVLGTFPSWLTLAVLAIPKGLLAIHDTDVAALFLSPERVLGRDLVDFRSVLNFKMSLVYALLASVLAITLTSRQFPRYFSALWKNARVPQLIYHGGLLFLGAAFSIIFAQGHVEPTFFPILALGVLLLSVENAWLASVVVNDHYDTAIDALTNPTRPLVTGTIPVELYRAFGMIFFLVSLLFAGIVSFSALLILVAYQALAWLYSAPPLRLKQYPLIATFFAATAGALILIVGFVSVAPSHNIATLPLPLLSYLFIAYCLLLPIKDFKDISGDAQDGVFTLPVLLGVHLGKQVFGTLIFLFYAGSPLFLNMRFLLLPALLFGSLSFFALQKGTASEASFFAYRKLPGIILALALCYGLTITVFLI